jgi:DNA-binding NtrC family response regulator
MLPTQGLVPHRVLLVDDDDDVRGVLHATLESKGFDVAAAANVTQLSNSLPLRASTRS